MAIAGVAGCSGDDSDGNGDTPMPDTDTETDAPTKTDEELQTPTEAETDTPTETETETETATEEPTPEPADEIPAQTFSGSGAEVRQDVEIEGGLTVVEATHTGGSSNFQVKLVPSEGEYDELFVNEIGEYNGETAALIEADTYTLDVEADGEWEIEIRQPRANTGESLPLSLDGDRNVVQGPYDFGGSHIASGSHNGEGNFQVHVYPPEGSFGELVFNEIGEFEGETTFRHSGVGWVAVVGDGEWSVDME